MRAKLATGYAMALSTIALLSTAGLVLGVRLAAVRWLEMVGLLLIGLLPFAALGVLLGHLLTADTIGPAAGGLVSLLALVSGNWFPLGEACCRTSPRSCRLTGSSRPATSRSVAGPGARRVGS